MNNTKKTLLSDCITEFIYLAKVKLRSKSFLIRA